MAGWNAVAPVGLSDEADDGLYGPERPPSKDRRSKLVRSKEKYPGQVVNACPKLPGFNCRDDELDEQMYCKHLVGFTDPDDESIYYPFKFRPLLDKNGNPIESKSTARRYRFTDGEDPQPVLPADRKVQASNCFRVYRASANVSAVKE